MAGSSQLQQRRLGGAKMKNDGRSVNTGLTPVQGLTHHFRGFFVDKNVYVGWYAEFITVLYS